MTAANKPMTRQTLLEVKDLRVRFPISDTMVPAVNGVSFDLEAGEIVGIVGESGSGKSLTASALLRMVPEFGELEGEVKFLGRPLFSMSAEEIRQIRGAEIALIPQNPLSALNPVLRIGTQLEACMLAHGKYGRSEARERAKELLHMVGIPDAEQRYRDFPHQFSGGMRQRIVIAMALSNNPKVIIADEATTALDVTIQAQILELLRKINRELQTSIVVITHNLGLAANTCDRLLVMYAGEVIEEGRTKTLLSNPAHPYTRALLNAVPRLDSPTEQLDTIPGHPPSVLKREEPGCPFAPRCERATAQCLDVRPRLFASQEDARKVACYHPVSSSSEVTKPVQNSNVSPRVHAAPLLALNDISRVFRVQGKPFSAGRLTALDGVSIQISAGECLGLVGESGSGKSTLARIAVGLTKPTSGQLSYKGTVLGGKSIKESAFRSNVQMVFQDPKSSLNPWLNVRQLVSEPLNVKGQIPPRERDARVIGALESVGLSEQDLARHVSEFSGGQQQRIALARALVLSPELIVLDEPVSSLDVSVQARVINLLSDLQKSAGISYLFVAHDLAVVQKLSHRIAVMYLGRVVETGDAEAISSAPLHPYTVSLYSAVPSPDFKAAIVRPRIVLHGDIPSPLNIPTGCPFHDRCPIGPAVMPNRGICVTHRPSLQEHADSHAAACHFPGELIASP